MTDTQRLILLIAGALLVWLVFALSPILTPFVVGALLGYLGDPVVDWLQTKRLSRTASVLVVFAGIVGILFLLLLVVVPVLANQLAVLGAKLPAYLRELESQLAALLVDYVPEAAQALEGGAKAWVDMLGQGQGLGDLARKVSRWLFSSGLAVVAALVNLVLIPVVTFYLLRDWDDLVAAIHRHLPTSIEPAVSRFARESDEVLSAFFRGQLLVMLALATIYGIGLAIAGLELGLLIGALAGLVSFVPYLGFIVGVALAVLAAVMQGGDPTALMIGIGVVFAIGQALETMVLTPVLVGDRIGLHPVVVIFAIMAGGQLAGFFGVLAALPVAAVVLVALRHTDERWLQPLRVSPSVPPND